MRSLPPSQPNDDLQRYCNKYQLALRRACGSVGMMRDDDVQIPIEEDYKQEHHHLVLDGILTLLPEQEEKNKPKKGIVVFAHGSGSSGGRSPRNQYVASVLNSSGIGTLLVDLLTEEEQQVSES